MSALMCKTKMAVEATEPARRPPSSSPRRPPTSSPRLSASQTTRFAPASSDPSPSASSSGGYYTSTSFPKHSSVTGTSTGTGSSSLSGFRHSLPDNPVIYDFSELRSATNNFLAKPRHSSSSSSCWRCSLRGKDVIVFRRKFRRKIEMGSLKELLGMICRSHLVSIAKLLGASVSGDNIFLAYEFVDGASLSDCLRNPKIPNFTVLGTWMSRMQVAADVAHGLDYIHNNTGLNMILVHNHIKSSSVLVTEPSFRAKICHFGTAQLCGEEDENDEGAGEGPSASPRLKRSDSRRMQFEGARGYMSPEFRVTGVATQKSDVYSFGVVLLELLSGEEPFKYKYDKESREFVRTSIIDTARAAVDGDGGGGAEGRLRKWVDRRLSDSFPVEVAEKLVRLGLECVEADPDRRPDMSRVEGKVSKLYMQSKSWSNSINVPTNISVSIGPR
ncbi:lysM domain receptor-like kinase 3 [Eucalyptus grandis]|uniref:lysM domain receptor-like kinase 3 n=1 Tax=Eucalyptus grandis TaxID=71139 RepID=UPI00192EE0F7|nr:lysM domain receptor-like kinase 3 [Eucalyptus grandis]